MPGHQVRDVGVGHGVAVRVDCVLNDRRRVVPRDADLAGASTLGVVVGAVRDAAAAAADRADVLGAGQRLGLAVGRVGLGALDVRAVGGPGSVVSASVPGVVPSASVTGVVTPLVPSLTASSSSSPLLHAAAMSDVAASTDRNLIVLRRLTSSTSCVLLLTLSGCPPTWRSSTTVSAATTGRTPAAQIPPGSLDGPTIPQPCRDIGRT